MGDVDLAALAADVRYLKDRADIIDALNRYTRGLDRLDKELMRSAYHPHATDDRGNAYHPHGYPNPLGREARVDWLIDAVGPFFHCSHHISNFTIDIQGDEAHCEAYVITTQIAQEGDEIATLGCARYMDRLERIDGYWAIAHREVNMDFQFTVPINKMAPDVLPGFRDRTDRTYARPLTPSADALARNRA